MASDLLSPQAWLEQRASELDNALLNRATDEAMRDLKAAVPRLARDDALAAMVLSFGRRNVQQVVSGAFADGLPVGPPSAAVVETFRDLVHSGLSVGDILKLYSVGQSSFWRVWMADLTTRIGEPALRAAVLDRSWGRLSAWLESQVDFIVEHYAEEHERWVRGALARRAQLLEGVLSEQHVDVENASMQLGYELRRWHVGVVMWLEEDSHASSRPDLTNLGLRLAEELGAERPLVIATSSSTVRVWLPLERIEIQDIVDSETVRRHPRVRIALGRATQGLDGFRSSHHEAQLARRLAAANDSRRVTSFDEFELACLMSAELVDVGRLVRHNLGPLAAANAEAHRLRETLRIYLANGLNGRQAAERLHVHKNTVYYRVRKAEELLGRPLTQRRMELEVALYLAHACGTAVLASSASPSATAVD